MNRLRLLWLALSAAGLLVLSAAGVGSSATVGHVVGPGVLPTNQGHCRVVDTRTGRSYSTLQAANDAGPTLAGDTLVVRGTCYGATTISKSLTIVGRHRLDAPTLDGGHSGAPVVTVMGGVTVALDDLIVTGGGVAGGVGGLGGGIFNDGGTVTLTNTTVTGNTARLGGGILNYHGGTVTLHSSTVSDNTGSGIENYDGGTAALDNSTVTGNTTQYGGGISNHYSTLLTLDDSTVAGNTARYDGGGIYNTGVARLTNSTVTGNTARSGGGIYNAGVVTLTGSTGTGNSPDDCVGSPLSPSGC